jgi:hypothetical protein
MYVPAVFDKIEFRTFFFRLVSKNEKIKICRIIILPVVLYGCETEGV